MNSNINHVSFWANLNAKWVTVVAFAPLAYDFVRIYQIAAR